MSLIDRAKNIIMTPKTEWAVIAAEDANANAIFMGYALPFIILNAVAFAVLSVILGVLGVWLTAIVVNALAPSFGSEKNMGRAMQLVVYSYTPMWVGGLLGIIPMLGWIGMLFGIYGLYLIYLGLPHTMKTPTDKVITYEVVSIIVLIIIYAIVTTLIAGILVSILGLGLASTVNWKMNM